MKKIIATLMKKYSRNWSVEFQLELSEKVRDVLQNVVDEQAHTLVRSYDWAQLPASTRIIFTDDIDATARAEADFEIPANPIGGGLTGLTLANQKASVIILDSMFVDRFQSKGESFDIAASILRHEMCHAVDNELRRNIQGLFDLPVPTKFGYIVSGVAETLWPEYFATRYSYLEGRSSTTKEFDFLSPAITLTRSSKHIAELSQNLMWLGRALGYAAGLATARNLDLNSYPAEFLQTLQRFRLGTHYENLVNALIEVDSVRPWRARSDLEPVTGAVSDTLQAIGAAEHFSQESIYGLSSMRIPVY
jgi:hypothetical protein